MTDLKEETLSQKYSESFKEQFILKLKEAVIEACNVKNVTPADISTTEPVVGGKDKLKLDSLDALEIIVMIEQRFDIRLSGDENSRSLFYSFEKMATHLLANASEEKIKAFVTVK